MLENHFDTAVFGKSQNYGRDKAKFALITGLMTQAIASVFIFTGFYACAWDVRGKITGYFGYGPEYEVATNPLVHRQVLTCIHRSHNPSHSMRLFLWRALFPKDLCSYTRRSCSRRDTGFTRPRPDCSSATFPRHGHSDLPSVGRSSLRFSTCSNGLVTALFRGS